MEAFVNEEEDLAQAYGLPAVTDERIIESPVLGASMLKAYTFSIAATKVLADFTTFQTAFVDIYKRKDEAAASLMAKAKGVAKKVLAQEETTEALETAATSAELHLGTSFITTTATHIHRIKPVSTAIKAAENAASSFKNGVAGRTTHAVVASKRELNLVPDAAGDAPEA